MPGPSTSRITSAADNSTLRPAELHLRPRATLTRTKSLPQTRSERQPAPSATQADLSRQIDRLEARLTASIARQERRLLRHIDAAAGRTEDVVDAAAGRTQTVLAARIDAQDQREAARIRAARVGWSKFVFTQCLKTFGSICLRNAPALISMALSLEVAGGIAGGPIGLAAVSGAFVAVMLAILLWEGYKAVKEYRALRREAVEAARTDTSAADAARQHPAFPRAPELPTEAPPINHAPLPWYHRLWDFGRFALHRGFS